MKKKNEIKKKNETLKIQDIKKNPATDVLHTIKRLKSEESFVIAVLVVVILSFLTIGTVIVFSTLNRPNENFIKSGPLIIEFSDNESGMSDVVEFNENDGRSVSLDMVMLGREFTVTNDSGINSWYAVYLDDYIDKINFDECYEKQFNKEDIYFSIDGSPPLSLKEAYHDGRYIITEGIISANDKVTHQITVWHEGNDALHYHGRIVVKYIR